MSMEFDEMKNIWHAHDQSAIRENKQELDMEQLVRKKAISTGRTVDRIEKMLIAVNILGSLFLLILQLIEGKSLLWIYILVAVMILTIPYVIFHRQKRVRAEMKFDRTVKGELEQAISNASYQVRLSSLGLIYGLVVIFVVMMGALEDGKSTTTVAILAIFFVIMFALGVWEHFGWHVSRKKRLIHLKEELLSEAD